MNFGFVFFLISILPALANPCCDFQIEFGAPTKQDSIASLPFFFTLTNCESSSFDLLLEETSGSDAQLRWEVLGDEGEGELTFSMGKGRSFNLVAKIRDGEEIWRTILWEDDILLKINERGQKIRDIPPKVDSIGNDQIAVELVVMDANMDRICSKDVENSNDEVTIEERHLFKNPEYPFNATHICEFSSKSIQLPTKREKQQQRVFVMTDRFLMFGQELSPEGPRFAWVMESPEIIPHIYQNLMASASLRARFDLIFTHDVSLLQIDSRFRYCPFSTSRIALSDRKIYEKTRDVSIVVSRKKETTGHIFRHQVVTLLKDWSLKQNSKLDIAIFGADYQAAPTKLETLKDFRFQIVVENTKSTGYFTEKLMDALLTGAVPVYYGTDLADFFDSRGFFQIGSLDDLERIFPTLTKEKYEEMLPFVKRNFKKAMEMPLPLEWMWRSGIREVIHRNMAHGTVPNNLPSTKPLPKQAPNIHLVNLVNCNCPPSDLWDSLRSVRTAQHIYFKETNRKGKGFVLMIGKEEICEKLKEEMLLLSVSNDKNEEDDVAIDFFWRPIADDKNNSLSNACRIRDNSHPFLHDLFLEHSDTFSVDNGDDVVCLLDAGDEITEDSLMTVVQTMTETASEFTYVSSYFEHPLIRHVSLPKTTSCRMNAHSLLQNPILFPCAKSRLFKKAASSLSSSGKGARHSDVILAKILEILQENGQYASSIDVPILKRNLASGIAAIPNFDKAHIDFMTSLY